MSTTLPDADRGRIRAEEIFREEVRAEIAQKQPGTLRQKLWGFFNSQLGGWILSTVLVGGGVWLFNYLAEAREKRESRRSQVERIAIEIDFRVQMCRDRLPEGPSRARKAMDNDFPPYGVFPNFRERTLLSLLWELQYVCRDDTQKARLGPLIELFSDSLGSNAEFTEKTLAKGVEQLDEAVSGLLPESTQ